MMRAIIAVVATVLVVSSCLPDPNLGYRVFKYNEENNILSLDPAFARSNNIMWATNQLYDGLVELDSTLQVVPSIAKRYDISDDGLTYTFSLRDDVYFHKDTCFEHGRRAVVAQDVVYSFERILDPAVGSPGSWIFAGRVDTIQPFEALDDTTFRMRLLEPFTPMLGILTMQYCNVVPREAVTYYGAGFRSHPVGCGPFAFKRWIENQALYLNANNDYYRNGQPSIDGIKVSFVGDKKIAFLELMSGNLDFFNGLESAFVDDLLTKEGSLQPKHRSQLRYRKAPYLNLEYIGINLGKGHPVLSDKRVRQAMNYAIDRQTMMAVLRNNIGKPAHAGVIPCGLPAYDPAKVPGYTYDLKKAEQLLSDAGYSMQQPTPVITIETNADYLDICTFVSNQWRKVGISTTIEVVESGLLRERMRQGDVDFFRGSWIADYPDGESYLCMFYSGLPAPPNYTRFHDPYYDELYEQAIKATDLTDKIKLYQAMDRLLVEEAPIIFLYYDEKAQFTSRRLSGLPSSAVNLLDVGPAQISTIAY